MNHLRTLPLGVMLAIATACAPTNPGTPAASASPMPGASAGPTPGATVAPVPSAGAASSAPAVPSPVPSVSGFTWAPGKLLKAYDFKGVAGIYYALAETAFYVIDAVTSDQTPRRYLVRKFNQDGTFQAAYKLAPAGKLDPRAVDGMAFDRRGIPFYTYNDFDPDVYRQENNDRTWSLRKLITATVLPADRLPSNALSRAGVSTLTADGDVFTLGVLRLDPDKAVTGNRKLTYVRAEEDQQPQAITSFDDPFEPTTLMTSSPTGTIFASGPLKAGGFGIKKVGVDQQLADFATVDALPKGMWAGAKGELYTSTETTSKAAKVRKYSPDGKLLGETEVTLADGSYLLRVAGLTFDLTGRAIVTGSGFDAQKQPMSGIFVFTE